MQLQGAHLRLGALGAWRAERKFVRTGLESLAIGDSKIGKHGTLLPQSVKTDTDKINLYFYLYFITWLKFEPAGSRCG